MPRLFSICRTNVPVLHPNVPPPPHYYADNLARLLSAVSSQYSDLLLDRERDYLRRVFGLSVDAHRLYARLLTRRGRWCESIRSATAKYRISIAHWRN
jgi:hypothetical protein